MANTNREPGSFGPEGNEPESGLTRRSVLKRSAASTSILLASGGIASFLAACGGDDSESSGGSGDVGVTDTEILIGMTAPITGPFPLAGRQFEGWTKRVFDRVNDEGGVHGRKLRLIALDDGAEVEQAIANAQRLVRQEEVFAMTASGTASVPAFIDFVVENGVPMLFPHSFYDGLIEPPKDGVFSLFASYSESGRFITEWAFDEKGPGSAVIVANNLDVWASSVTKAQEAVEAKGGEVLDSLEASYEQPEWGSIVLQIKNANPDYVIMANSAPAEGELFKEMSRQNALPKKAVLGVTTIVDQAFIDTAGKIPDDFVYGAVSTTVPPGDPLAEEVQAMWPEETMGVWGLQGAAGAETMIAAFDKVGEDLTREKLNDVLLNDFGPFELPYSAQIESSDTHLLCDKFSIAGVKGGKFERIGDEFA